MDNVKKLKIIGIAETNILVTFEQECGDILLKDVPLSRIMLSLMACSNKSDDDLASLSSVFAGVDIGITGTSSNKVRI